MLVQRWEHKVKPGHVQEAVALTKEALALPNAPQYKRVYTSRIGESNRLAVEWEWESLADYEKAWPAFFATPGWAAFAKKWDAIRDESKEEFWTAVPV